MDAKKRNPRAQGEKGELSAAVWYLENGAQVYIPVLHNHPHVDLIANWGHRADRVQVKTSTQFHNDRWAVSICTRGGNRSWNGIVKRLDPSQYDRLFVHVGDGRRWLIPSGAVAAGTSVRLGGPKYSEYEIDRGEPL